MQLAEQAHSDYQQGRPLLEQCHPCYLNACELLENFSLIVTHTVF